jgi:putative oxidoreductase
MNNAIVLLARLFLAHIFLLAGFGKITGYAGTQGYMESMGVPGALLPLVIVLEIGGGLALIVGLFTRWAALALALFCVAAAVIFHRNFAEQMQMIQFMKNFAMAGGLLLLYVHGSGAFSIDARRGK